MQQHAAANIDPSMVTKIEHSSPPHHSPYAEGDPLVDGYTGNFKNKIGRGQANPAKFFSNYPIDYSFTHAMTVPMAVAYTQPPPPYPMPTARVSYHPFVSEKMAHPGSPESSSTSSTPHTPPLRAQASNESLNQAVSYSSNTAARVKETIAKASAVPMELYHTEFLTYSKEAYERKNDNRKVKRKRAQSKEEPMTTAKKGKKRSTPDVDEDDEDDEDELDE